MTNSFCLLAGLLVAAIYPWLAPLGIGEVAEFCGEPALALSQMRRSPEWAVPPGRLSLLGREAQDRSHESTLRLPGALVSFDSRTYDESFALKTGRVAQAARTRIEARLAVELPAVPVRLPLWRDPALLGAYDHLAVNLSPLGAGSARVILHETAHFAWYERLLAMPGLPVSTPLWMEEGLAEMLATVETGGTLPAATAASLEELDRQVAREHDYEAAASWVGYLVSTRGWEPTRAFLRALRSGSPTWEALGRAYGAWPEDLLEEWRASTPAPAPSPPSGPGVAIAHRAIPETPLHPSRHAADAIDLTLSAALVFVALRILTLAWRFRAFLLWWPVLLLANRAAWGAGVEMLTIEGWMPFLPYIWRHRLLWVFDAAILFFAAGARRPELDRKVLVLSAATAATATGLALLSGQASLCLPRLPDAGLLLVLALLPLRCCAEARMFVTTGGSKYLLAGLYALLAHGPAAGWPALLSRFSLALAAGRSGAPGAVLAGWELAGPILLWREAMAPAKLGAVTFPAGGAAGLDAWPPVAIALLLAAAWGSGYSATRASNPALHPGCRPCDITP